MSRGVYRAGNSGPAGRDGESSGDHAGAVPRCFEGLDLCAPREGLRHQLSHYFQPPNVCVFGWRQFGVEVNRSCQRGNRQRLGRRATRYRDAVSRKRNLGKNSNILRKIPQAAYRRIRATMYQSVGSSPRAIDGKAATLGGLPVTCPTREQVLVSAAPDADRAAIHMHEVRARILADTASVARRGSFGNLSDRSVL